MNMHHPLSPRRQEAVTKHRHAGASPALPRQHPLIELQRRVGNQAVLRLLRRRPTSQAASVGTGGPTEARIDRASEFKKDEGVRLIRHQLAERNKWIVRAFEQMEFALLLPERKQKLPIIQGYKMTFQASGILSLGMIDDLARAIFPIRFPEQYEQQLQYLREYVREKQELLEGLEDPEAWYDEYQKKVDRSLGRRW